MNPTDPETPQKPRAWAFFSGSGKQIAICACAEGMVNAAPIPVIVLRMSVCYAIPYQNNAPTLQSSSKDKPDEVRCQPTDHCKQCKESHAKEKGLAMT